MSVVEVEEVLVRKQEEEGSTTTKQGTRTGSERHDGNPKKFALKEAKEGKHFKEKVINGVKFWNKIEENQASENEASPYLTFLLYFQINSKLSITSIIVAGL